MTSASGTPPLLSTVARFVAALIKELRWRLAASVAVVTTLAFMEGAGLLLLIPLLGSVGLVVDEGAASRLAAAVERVFAAAGIPPTLLAVLAIFLLVSAAHALLVRTNLLLNVALEQQFAVALRQRLYAAIAHARWPFLLKRRTNDLVHAVIAEVDRTASAAYQLLVLLTGLVVTAAYVAIAFRLSPALTAIVAAAAVVLLWAQGRRTRRSSDLGEKYSTADRRQFHMASESMSAIRIARSFGAEERDTLLFARLAQSRADAYLTLVQSFAHVKFRTDISTAIVISALLFVAVQWLELRGAGLLLLIFVFARVMPRLMSLQGSAQTLLAGLPAFQLVSRLIEECEAEAEELPTTASSRQPLHRELRLEGVSYTYDPGGPVVLDDVSLVIPAGRITAILGASGAGKSTLADLLIGLLRPSRGRIVVDGRALDDAAIAVWRRSIGYVPQDTFLLHDTVRANLLWARPDVTEAAMWAALDLAAAARFIRERPEGLDTVVGDRGVQLSGGERQRLSLARALLTEPDLLVLDEATSALDGDNEAQVLAAVQALPGRVTTVIITHRLSAIRAADLIHVLDNGRLVESGTWPELTARPGTFARLLLAQGVDLVRPAQRVCVEAGGAAAALDLTAIQGQ